MTTPRPADRGAGEAPPPPADSAQGAPGTADRLGPADIRLAQRAADAAAVESERLHVRRLQTVWLHGTRRTAADRMTAWPWVLVGLLIVVLIVAGLGIAAAFRAQQRADQQQQRGLGISGTPFPVWDNGFSTTAVF